MFRLKRTSASGLKNVLENDHKMKVKSINPGRKICLIPILAVFAALASFTDTRAAGLNAAHDLNIELIPSESKLIGSDEIKIKSTGDQKLTFRISRNLSQIGVMVNGDERDFKFENGHLQIKLKASEKNSELQVGIKYTGIFDDPVPVRPVNTDNPGYGVTGTISPLGTFLLAGAGWYPDLLNSAATYRISVVAPEGLIAVTAGRSLGHLTRNGKTTSLWEVDYPVRGLALSAARYIVEEQSVGKVKAATYLLPQNQHLAASYLKWPFTSQH